MNASEVLYRLDGRLTARMLDYWLRTGQVKIEHPVLTGSGGRRQFTQAEFRAIKRMCDERDFINESQRRFANGELWAQLIKEEQDG
jgi:DNA-binding transcriptional MerR regulator